MNDNESYIPDFSNGIRIPQVPIPDVIIDTPGQHMWADEQFRILKKYIQEFEASLDSEHEVGVMLTNFGQSVLMQVTSLSYEDPVLIIFRGYVNNQEATLIQHINQLNFLLTSVKKEDEKPKRKIGFDIES